MAWTYEDIQRDWLAGNRIAVAPADVVAAFDRCERVLGREWTDQARGNRTGTAPTLKVVSMGQELAALEDVAGSEQLVEKIRSGDPSAIAELRAIHLLRSQGGTAVELEPLVRASDADRKCDFRIQRNSEGWAYVEVTRPDVSEANARVESLLQTIIDQVSSIKKVFTLEVFLRREPTEEEAASLFATSLDLCAAENAAQAICRRELVADLGFLILNQHPAGQFVLNDHGEEPVPRLGAMKAIVGPGEPNRHVAVRMAYADQRAERFLTREARQLPTDAPGLILVEMLKAPGGFRSWEPVLQRRFQPAMHTRVGGACLFSSGLVPTPDGEAALYQTKLILNQHARIPLPEWIATTLEGAGRRFELLTAPPAPAVSQPDPSPRHI